MEEEDGQSRDLDVLKYPYQGMLKKKSKNFYNKFTSEIYTISGELGVFRGN